MKRVAITAFGCCTPIGNTYSEVLESIKHGHSGIKKINKFNTHGFKTPYAGVPNIPSMPQSNTMLYDHVYANYAASKLTEHAGYNIKHLDPHRIGCFIGVDEPVLNINDTVSFVCREIGGILDGKKNDPDFSIGGYLRLDPASLLKTIHSKVPFMGPAMTHVGLCSASLQAIGVGFESIANGRVDAAIVGGISAKVTQEHYVGLESVDVICTDETINGSERSRPFDIKRSGYIPAEGAVLFLLEDYDSAISRGATPLLEIVGFGTSLNATHIVKPAPDSSEMKNSMVRALKSARLSPNEIDLVNAHGTSTVLNDYHESDAICSVLSNSVPVTANKSLHGHLIAAAGAMETLNTLISMNEDIIPGTINIESRDPSCKANIIQETMKSRIEYCMKNSFGMGGLAATIIFKNV